MASPSVAAASVSAAASVEASVVSSAASAAVVSASEELELPQPASIPAAIAETSNKLIIFFFIVIIRHIICICFAEIPAN